MRKLRNRRLRQSEAQWKEKERRRSGKAGNGTRSLKHEHKREREKRASIFVGFKYINFQFSRSVVLSVRDNYTIGRGVAIYHVYRSFALTSVARTRFVLFLSGDDAKYIIRAKMLFFRINSLAPIIDICSRAMSNAELIRFARNRCIRCILITMLTDERSSSIILLSIFLAVRNTTGGSDPLAHNCFQIVK